MEEKETKKTSLLTIVLVILLLVSLGYIAYDKFIKKEDIVVTDCKSLTDEEKQKIEEEQKEQEEKEETKTETKEEKKEETTNTDYVKNFYNNMVKNRTVVADYGKGISIVLDKKGNVYYNASEVKNAVGKKDSYSLDGYVAGPDEKTGKLSNVFNGYKLDISNVVQIHHAESGNGGYEYYILIKADGTIGRLVYLQNDRQKSEIEIIEFKETVSGYKNIVSVEQANGWDAHDFKLIDIDGNILD